ncbi:queuine trna-ribosyltransferase accessory subunit 2 [Holotrichia oblita]|uniref:Queuine trna-ribosyltransferase accessory subunit 2 n=1 Tax=Holotrichia oblita TaxID=644536 RepID=A0ACB9TX02_HOLOL|nr:queuine trna-ribosyltransferase accessory subunit 2 [Holotrichia oblita]
MKQHLWRTTLYVVQVSENLCLLLTGMKSCISCVSVQDPGDLTQPGHHYKDYVPLWTRSGKILLNSDKYMDIIESFKPDMYYLLSDGDTNVASAQKRVTKAVDNTINFVNKCLERHKNSTILQNAFVMAPITGGYCLRSRKRCLDELKDKELIDGFLIDGLHNNGPEVEFLTFAEIKDVIDLVVKDVPDNKLLSVQGCWNPVTLIKMVQKGIDVFDTSYCYIVTERSSALTFSMDKDSKMQAYEINLRQLRYADDFQPILPGCECLTCTKHSRGYIYHLVAVQELLGSLLLTIHNIHHFMKFFEKIRHCIAEGTLSELENLVTKQFDEYQDEIMQGKEKKVLNDENL